MTLLNIIILSLIQGLTEFLPVSSSGHLALLPMLSDFPDQGLIMDVAVHVGTLFAVVIYFWRDIVLMVLGIRDWVSSYAKASGDRLGIKRKDNEGLRLALQVVLATVPVVIAGLLVMTYVGDGFRSLEIIAWTILGFGVVLYVADRFFGEEREVKNLSYRHAFLIGLAQVLALIPGTSRSGITMTVARFLKYKRTDSAHFSMLLSMPTIFAAGTLTALKIYEAGDVTLTVSALLAALLSFFAALVAIWGMMAWLKRASFTPFVIYRIVLGSGLLAYVYC